MDLDFESQKVRRNPRKLMDFDIDRLFRMYEDLAAFDLDDEKLVKITNEIDRRFSTKSVIINEFTSNEEEIRETPRSNVIQFKNAAILENVLKNFGSLIRDLSLTTPDLSRCEYDLHSYSTTSYDVSSYKTIFNLIYEYCFDSLVELKLRRMHHDFLKNIPKPFKNVESLELNNNVTDLKIDRFNFSEAFPSLRHLQLDSMTAINLDEIVLNYPKLESFGFCNQNEDLAKEIILKNVQIQKISLQRSSPEMLDFVINHLPNIESLELAQMDILKNIHSENVKVFKASNVKWLEKISFGDKLEEFYDLSFQLEDQVLDFIENNKKLKTFAITKTSQIKNGTLERFIKAKLNASKIHLYFEYYMPTDEIIIRLIESAKHLEKLQLDIGIRNYENNDLVDSLSKYFHNSWKIYWFEHSVEWHSVISIVIEKNY